jgi:mono/diheme cytochrome c family protein
MNGMIFQPRRGSVVIRTALAAALWVTVGLVPARAEPPEQILASYAKAAGEAGSPERGQAFFTRRFSGDNLADSCSACHGRVPTGKGKDTVSGKAIAPLAPAANPQRLTDASKVENALRLNCRDVVGRLCTPQEKADVLSWLISLRP